MGAAFKVNSDYTLAAYFKNVREMYDECKNLRATCEKWSNKTILQNGLFHVWLREWIAHRLRKDMRDVTKSELAGIKRTTKKIFYRAYGYAWMIHEITDYDTGLIKKDYTSSGDWAKGEMYLMLNFLQMVAAEQGCVLEAKGEYKNLKEKSES